MLVHRVERFDGVGPYTSDMRVGDAFDAQYDMLVEHNGPDYPTPAQDKGIDRLPSCGEEWCALLDASDVLSWFAGFHAELDEARFHVSVYDAKDLLIGDSGQVIFRKDTATKINTLTFRELKNLGQTS